MKAYMSVPGVRSILTDVCGCDAGEAELEAYIIIRETEPADLWRLPAWDFTPLRIAGIPESCQIRNAADAGGPWEALAEALAAFVDDGQGVRS